MRPAVLCGGLGCLLRRGAEFPCICLIAIVTMIQSALAEPAKRCSWAASTMGDS